MALPAACMCQLRPNHGSRFLSFTQHRNHKDNRRIATRTQPTLCSKRLLGHQSLNERLASLLSLANRLEQEVGSAGKGREHTQPPERDLHATCGILRPSGSATISSVGEQPILICVEGLDVLTMACLLDVRHGSQQRPKIGEDVSAGMESSSPRVTWLYRAAAQSRVLTLHTSRPRQYALRRRQIHTLLVAIWIQKTSPLSFPPPGLCVRTVLEPNYVPALEKASEAATGDQKGSSRAPLPLSIHTPFTFPCETTLFNFVLPSSKDESASVAVALSSRSVWRARDRAGIETATSYGESSTSTRSSSLWRTHACAHRTA